MLSTLMYVMELHYNVQKFTGCVGKASSTAREHVSFLVEGEDEGVEWGRGEVVEEVERQLGMALDVDVSRFQNMSIQEVEWVCGM